MPARSLCTLRQNSWGLEAEGYWHPHAAGGEQSVAGFADTMVVPT